MKFGLVQIEKVCRIKIYSLPNNKILAWPELKAFAHNKIKLKMMILGFDRVENILRKGANAGYHCVFK